MDKNLSVGIQVGATLSGGFETAIGTATTALDKVGAAVAGVDQKGDGARISVGRLADEMKAGDAAADQHADGLRGAGNETDKLRSDTDRLNDALGKLADKQRAVGDLMNRQQANLQRRADLRGQMFDTVAMGAVMAAPLAAAIRFESVMADVRKVVDFDTPEQFKEMSADLLRMSTVIPLSVGELGNIAAAAGQAGIAREEIVKFTEDAAKMGVAFDLTGEQAGSAMTGLRTIFKLNQTEVVLLGDAYNHLSNSMDATAGDMLQISNRAGSTADLFGLTGQQLGALGATFLALKTPPEVAATGINALLMKLQNADKQSAAFQDALAEIGLSASDLKYAIEEDAQGALLSFLEAVDTAENKSGVLFDLFGQEYVDDMTKLVGGLDQYKKALSSVGDESEYAGSMLSEYKNKSETTENQLRRLGSTVNMLGVTIGSALLPALNSVLAVITPVIQLVADAAGEFPILTASVIGLAVGLATLKVVTLATSYAWTFVVGGWIAAKKALVLLQVGVALANTRLIAFNATALITGAVTRALAVGGAVASFASTLVGLATKAVPVVIGALKALRVALMANPIGLIIGGIALAAGYLISNWEPVGEFFGNLWDGVKAGAEAVFGWLADAWETVSGWFGGDGDKTVTVKPDNVVDFPTVTTDNTARVGSAVAANDDYSAPVEPVRMVSGGDTYQVEIHIHQQPGEDAEALANRAADIVVAKMKRANRGRSGGRFE